jgi:hypothetical protein
MKLRLLNALACAVLVAGATVPLLPSLHQTELLPFPVLKYSWRTTACVFNVMTSRSGPVFRCIHTRRMSCTS